MSVDRLNMPYSEW